jgi:hypothetical protein
MSLNELLSIFEPGMPLIQNGSDAHGAGRLNTKKCDLGKCQLSYGTLPSPREVGGAHS